MKSIEELKKIYNFTKDSLEFDKNLNNDFWLHRWFFWAETIINTFNQSYNMKELNSLEFLIDEQKKINNKKLDYFLKSLPGMKQNLEYTELALQNYGFTIMYSNYINDYYKKNNSSKLYRVNGFEYFIFYDKKNESYTASYLGDYITTKNRKECYLLMEILKDNKMDYEGSLNLAEMILYG